MREIVLVISDLHLPPAEPGSSSKLGGGAADGLSSLQYIARFGQKSVIREGWRSWLARWVGRDDLATVAPAAMAAAASAGANTRITDGTTWFATPVHLIAGLTSLHLDRRSILQLTEEELRELARDFDRVFGTSEFRLETTASTSFLMRNRETIAANTTEPARAVVSELQSSLPTGPNAPVLRRLGAELEMWLHGHPINQQRTARGELPISTLWLWGGGRAPDSTVAGPRDAADVGLGSDPFLVGLWRLQGSEPLPLPERLLDLASYPHARRFALIAAVTPLLHANPQWSILDALADLERRFIAPALAALRSGKVSSVVLIANDIQLRINHRDPLRFWRKAPRSALEVLSEK